MIIRLFVMQVKRVWRGAFISRSVREWYSSSGREERVL